MLLFFEHFLKALHVWLGLGPIRAIGIVVQV